MNKQNISPGPWKVDQTTGTNSLVLDAEGNPVGHFNERVEDQPLRTSGQPMRKANAALAAAAPQLAEAVISMAKQDAREDWTRNFGEEEAKEYADENWHEFLTHDAAFALRAAGYLNESNNPE